jgi:hypothetical protein
MDRGAPQPLPLSNPGANYVPPTMTTPVPKSLSATLADAHLAQYETKLRELGAAFPSDLSQLEEQDLVEIGMKKLEIARFMRLAAEFADDSTC